MDKVNLNYIKSNRKLEPIDFLVLIQNKNLKEYIDYLTTIHYENPIEFQDKIIDMLSKFSIERGSMGNKNSARFCAEQEWPDSTPASGMLSRVSVEPNSLPGSPRSNVASSHNVILSNRSAYSLGRSGIHRNTTWSMVPGGRARLPSPRAPKDGCSAGSDGTG